MTDSPSDTPDSTEDVVDEAVPEQEASAAVAEPAVAEESPAVDTEEAPEDAPAPSEFDVLAARVADVVGSDQWTAEHRTVKISVSPDRWKEAIAGVKALGEFPFFSWLSAVDWAREVAVGDGVAAPDDLDERLEVMCRLSSMKDDTAVTIVTSVPRSGGSLESVATVYGGADWHERECYEMFGIDFVGHPNLIKLYLPDAFEGHPLRKDYPLLSREVKPWPGTVDVEAKPTTENVEADTLASDGGDS
ncbi:MAG: NADH-quinone oxidoreductase subunit C [Acidimicrobiia bacterium]|nr:NADH-quinone oxidoreductase subunit C [Acidimicrobiia bacterium]